MTSSLPLPILALALAPGLDPEPWLDALAERLDGFEVLRLEDVAARERVRYVAAWRHRHGSLADLPGLQAVISLGAGVDHLLADPALPAVSVVRVVDPDLTARMSEWVVLHVLLHHRQQRLYDYQQSERIWDDDPFQPAAADVRVGVMGQGVMGEDAARKLDLLGFDVAGWSRTPKPDLEWDTYAGEAELAAFLARTQILVVLLPLTPDTRGLLDRPLFEQLARDGHTGGPILINAGRGGLQDEKAILACLEDGTLRAATLDVFWQEPLPQDSPLWHHPAVTVTPHNAAISKPEAVAGFVAREILLHEAGEPLQHVVDPKAGY